MTGTNIRLSSEVLKGAQSFAIDFGGSVLKIAYLSREESKDGFRTICCTSFPRADFSQALEFIKANCDIPKAEGGEGGELPLYVLTGVGVYQYEKKLKEELGIRVSNAWEGECFNRAMSCLLEHLPDEQLFHPPLVEDDEEAKEMAEKIQKFRDAIHPTAEPVEEVGEDEPDKEGPEPYIQIILGSAFGYTAIYPDGRMVPGFMSPRGGRMFLGLGSILSGAKTYEELIALAEAGNDRNVNVYANDLVKDNEGSQGESAYQNLMNLNVNAFGFGWGVGKTAADFKREDLVRALLVNLCHEIVMSAFSFAKITNVKKIIVVGGFAQSTLPRALMEKEFLRGKIMTSLMQPTSPLRDATFRTLSAGSYLGAIGAILRSREGATQPESKVIQNETKL